MTRSAPAAWGGLDLRRRQGAGDGDQPGGHRLPNHGRIGIRRNDKAAARRRRPAHLLRLQHGAGADQHLFAEMRCQLLHAPGCRCIIHAAIGTVGNLHHADAPRIQRLGQRQQLLRCHTAHNDENFFLQQCLYDRIAFHAFSLHGYFPESIIALAVVVFLHAKADRRFILKQAEVQGIFPGRYSAHIQPQAGSPPSAPGCSRIIRRTAADCILLPVRPLQPHPGGVAVVCAGKAAVAHAQLQQPWVPAGTRRQTEALNKIPVSQPVGQIFVQRPLLSNPFGHEAVEAGIGRPHMVQRLDIM